MKKSQIKEKYKIFEYNGNTSLYKLDGTFEDFCGSVKFEGEKVYYIGLLSDEPVYVKNMTELDECVKKFLKVCDEQWIDCRSQDPQYNNAYRAELAMWYLVRKFGWKRNDMDSSFSYIDPITHANLFDLVYKSDINKDNVDFTIAFQDGSFISREFTDYVSAMNWLREVIGYRLLISGATCVKDAIAVHNPDTNISSIMDGTELIKYTFTSTGVNVERKSYKDLLVLTLEDLLNKLKS